MAYPGESLAISSNNVTLVATDPSDPAQLWKKVEVELNSGPVFALVNLLHSEALCAKDGKVSSTRKFKSGEEAIKIFSSGQWKTVDRGDGFVNIISADGNAWTAEEGEKGTINIMLRANNNHGNQLWQIRTIRPLN